MRHIIQKHCVFLIYTLLALGLVLTPEVVIAQTKVPLEGQSGIIEKSLEQSRPFIPVPDPGMYIESSKTPKAKKDSKAGPLIFVKKIKFTGNTVFSDEILMSVTNYIATSKCQLHGSTTIFHH